MMLYLCLPFFQLSSGPSPDLPFCVLFSSSKSKASRSKENTVESISDSCVPSGLAVIDDLPDARVKT